MPWSKRPVALIGFGSQDIKIIARLRFQSDRQLARDQEVSKCAQVIVYPCSSWKRFWQDTPGIGCTFAGQDQMRLTSCACTRLQIARRIADGRHAMEVHPISFTDLLEQPRARLSAAAPFVGPVWAVKNRIYPGTNCRQHPVHLVMHCIQGRHVKQSTAQARLVGCNHHMPARVVESSD